MKPTHHILIRPDGKRVRVTGAVPERVPPREREVIHSGGKRSLVRGDIPLHGHDNRPSPAPYSKVFRVMLPSRAALNYVAAQTASQYVARLAREHAAREAKQ